MDREKMMKNASYREKADNLKKYCEMPIEAGNTFDAYTKYSLIGGNELPSSYESVLTYTVKANGNFFVVLREIAKAFIKGTVWNKKARIVIEYDPGEDRMNFSTFMSRDEV